MSGNVRRSEEHTSELQSQSNLVCRLLLERSRDHRDLHSFPTRRSSDLTRRMPSRSSPPVRVIAAVRQPAARMSDTASPPIVQYRRWTRPATVLAWPALP